MENEIDFVVCILFVGLFVFVFWWEGGGCNSIFIDEFVIKVFVVIVYVVCIWLIWMRINDYLC